MARKGSATVDAATLGEVVRTRAPVPTGGPPAAVHVPIELGPRMFGVLSLIRDDSREFGRDDLALIAKVARISAAALANADAFQQERHLARTLTHGFVPEALPSVPGWDVGVLYQPADDQPTGGDLYGAWPLPGGNVAVVIGDVVGKGVETAALSAMARFFIEARSWDVEDPGAVLEQVNTMLYSRLPSDRFVTAFFGLLGQRSCATRMRATSRHWCCAPTAGSPRRWRVGCRWASTPRPAMQSTSSSWVPTTSSSASPTASSRHAVRASCSGPTACAGSSSTASMTREPQTLTELVHDDVRAWARGLSDDAAIVALRRRGLAVVD